MAELLTRADSIRFYLSGAGSDGGAQASPDAALGNYRSSTECSPLGISVTSPISNVTISFAAGANGTGSGSLTAIDANNLAWTPPGGTQGAAVTIANGESKLLEGGGSGTNKFIRVTRTSAASLSGTATVTLTTVYNDLVGFDNVSSSEASAGDNEYRAFCVKNVNSVAVSALKIFLKTQGTAAVSNSAQLGGSGSGTITTSGSFADWPASGYARIETNVPALKEIVYYSSRTSTSLTVPSAGRGLLGTSATAGAATDTVYSVPGIRIGKEAPAGSSTTGNAQTIANEGTAPSGITWNTGITAGGGLSIGDLATGEIYFVWIHRAIPAGATSAASVLQGLTSNFDAA